MRYFDLEDALIAYLPFGEFLGVVILKNIMDRHLRATFISLIMTWLICVIAWPVYYPYCVKRLERIDKELNNKKKE